MTDTTTEQELISRVYVCDYGMRHKPNEECDCYYIFWCYYWKFYDWLTDRWYKFEYPSDIQKSWIQEYLNILNKRLWNIKH